MLARRLRLGLNLVRARPSQSVSLTRIAPVIQRRHITQAFAFSENGVPPPQHESPVSKRYRIPLVIVTLLIASYAGFKYLISNNYPPEVAKKLREGLRAEIDGNGKGKRDFNLALEKYLEALQIADDLGMDKISDEYTGLQIKICEMYEMLGMKNEAKLMYQEISVAFVTALNENNVPSALRPHIIQRDLRVAIKTAMNQATTEPGLAKLGLMLHFQLAQNEVASKDPEFRDLIESEKKTEKLDLTIDLRKLNEESEQSQAWQPFRDELFNARDVYVALCMATGDMGRALQAKVATTRWMVAAGCDIGSILMSFYNVGSIFYVQAEELEYRHFQGGENAERHQKLAEQCISHSEGCFNGILTSVNNLPSKYRQDDQVREVQAMSVYGLGVIALHQGKFDLASERLREARLRAKGCDLADLEANADQELAKVEKYRSESQNGVSLNRLDGAPTLDVMFVRRVDDDNDSDQEDKP